jgi:hypothetical protein
MVQELKQTCSLPSGGSARWLVAVFLAAVAGALLVELGRTATADLRCVEELGLTGRGVLVVPSQISRDGYGVYLIDSDKGRMCVYQYQPASGKLRLLASRNFIYDLALEDYNTLPSPREVKDLVEQKGPTSAPATMEAPGAPVEE